MSLLLAVQVITPATTQPAATATAAANAAVATWPLVPNTWPAQNDLLTWCQTMGPATAAVLVIAGVVYLAFGVYLYRALITLNAAAVGVYIGGMLGAKAGNALAGAMVGGCAAAALTYPGMKYAVAIMGGAFGAALGASIWRAMDLQVSYVWAGGMMGLIFFGMLSFILFRGSIMMYFSTQGAVMLVFGILGMLYKYQGLGSVVNQNLALKPFILPLAIFVPAIVGLIYQQTAYPPAPPAKK